MVAESDRNIQPQPPKLAWLIWIVVRRLTRNMARINWMIASWDEVPVMNGVGGVMR